MKKYYIGDTIKYDERIYTTNNLEEDYVHGLTHHYLFVGNYIFIMK